MFKIHENQKRINKNKELCIFYFQQKRLLPYTWHYCILIGIHNTVTYCYSVIMYSFHADVLADVITIDM